MAKVVKYILDISSGKAEAGLEKVSRSAKKTEKSLDRTRVSGLKMSKALKVGAAGMAVGVLGAAAAVGTLAIAFKAAAEAAVNLTKDVVDSVNRLNDLSAVSGVAAETIQGVSAAFVASGQEASKADAFISKFPKTYTQLAIEGSRAATAAQSLGVAIKNQDGSMKTSNEVLIGLTKGLQSIEDDSERAKVGFELFGGAAAGFLQALGKTSNLENFINLTERFGVQVGEEASASAAKFQAQLSVLSTVAAGLKQKFVTASGGVNVFNSFLRGAIVVTVALQEMIDNNMDAFSAFGKGIAKVGKAFFSVIQSMMSEFGSIINAVMDNIAGNLALIAKGLHFVGAISDDTFTKLVNIANGLDDIGDSAKTIGTKIESTDFSGNTEGAKEALANLDAILAGVNVESIGAVGSVNDLTSSVEDLAAGAAGAAGKVERTAEEIKFDKTLENIDKFIASTQNEFAKLGKSAEELEIERMQAVIDRLDEAITFLGENGFNTDMQEAIKLRIQAESELSNLMNDVSSATDDASESLEEFTVDLVSLGESFGAAIDSVGSPEALLGNLENMFGLAQQSAGLIEQGANQLSSRMIDTALSGESGNLVAGLAAKGAGAASSAAGAAGALAGAGAAVPVVGALGAIAVALAKLGESTEEDINERFDTFIENLDKGVELLPEILKNVLPEFIAQLTKIFLVDLTKLLVFDLPLAIIVAFVRLIPELIKQIVLVVADAFKGIVGFVDDIKEFFNILSDPDEIRRVGRELGEAIVEEFKSIGDFFTEAFSMRSGGRFIPSARGGLRFTGGEEGLAMLHQGEFVVPESNVMSQAVNRRLNNELGGGINLTINADIIEGSAVDALVRKIEQRFRTFGGSTSPLFGGI